jgi:hypothetical protein
VFNLIVRIYFIHLFAILAITLATYFPGLDIILALIYIAIVLEEGFYCAKQLQNLFKQILVALTWQIPGFLLIILVIINFPALDYLNYYAIFLLEIWATPLIPFVSLLPPVNLLGHPIYYYCFFINVLVVTILYIFPGFKTVKSPQIFSNHKFLKSPC